MSNIKLLDQLNIHQKLFYQIKSYFFLSKTSLTLYIYLTSRTRVDTVNATLFVNFHPVEHEYCHFNLFYYSTKITVIGNDMRV